jgi:hypothetical protein
MSTHYITRTWIEPFNPSVCLWELVSTLATSDFMPHRSILLGHTMAPRTMRVIAANRGLSLRLVAR